MSLIIAAWVVSPFIHWSIAMPLMVINYCAWNKLMLALPIITSSHHCSRLGFEWFARNRWRGTNGIVWLQEQFRIITFALWHFYPVTLQLNVTVVTKLGWRRIVSSCLWQGCSQVILSQIGVTVAISFGGNSISRWMDQRRWWASRFPSQWQRVIFRSAWGKKSKASLLPMQQILIVQYIEAQYF